MDHNRCSSDKSLVGTRWSVIQLLHDGPARYCPDVTTGLRKRADGYLAPRGEDYVADLTQHLGLAPMCICLAFPGTFDTRFVQFMSHLAALVTRNSILRVDSPLTILT